MFHAVYFTTFCIFFLDCFSEVIIHVSEVNYIVTDDAENYLMEGPGVDVDEENIPVYKAIGGYLSELIPDEATL